MVASVLLDSPGARLAQSWAEFKKVEPIAAAGIEVIVNGAPGLEHSLEFYIGFKEGLMKTGELAPSLTVGDSEESQTYKRMFSYVEYEIRESDAAKKMLRYPNSK